MHKELFDTKEITLNNGLKLVLIKKDTRIFSINAGIKVGSLYEKKDEKGIAHFLEHMLFKGTSLRNNEALNNELEQLGGEYNAYTEYSSTVYSITALSEEIEKSIELISDMLQNSIFDEEELEKEREVILAEIRTSKDDVEDYSFIKTNEIAFKKSPLKNDIVGEVNTVKKFNKKQLKQYYEKHYVPNNAFISIVSPFDHTYVLDFLNNYFGNWEKKELEVQDIIIEKNIPIKKINYKKNIEQASIIYLFTFYNLDRKDELTLKILDHKFGESTNSILFRELREKKGLAYDVYSEINTTKLVKTLYIYTAVSKENVNKAIETIDSCIEKIKNEEIIFDQNTTDLMKKVLKTAVASTLEDSTDLANYVLHQAMDDENIYEFTNDMEMLKEIDKKDIYDIARKILNDPTIHILLPKESEKNE